MEPFNQLIFVVACITAAQVWNNFGYFQEWRLNRNNPDWKGFDLKALKHDLLLGTILGVGVVVYQAMTAGTQIGFAIPQYTSVQVFIVSVATMFGPVAAVDKAIVGGFMGINSRTITIPTPQPGPQPPTPQPKPTPKPAFTSNFVPSPDGKTHGIKQGDDIRIQNSFGPDYMFYGILEELDENGNAKIDSVIWDGFNDEVKDGILVIKTQKSITVTNKDGTTTQVDVNLPKGNYRIVLKDDPTPTGSILGETDDFEIF